FSSVYDLGIGGAPSMTISQRSINRKAALAALLGSALAATPNAIAQSYTILHDFGPRPDGRGSRRRRWRALWHDERWRNLRRHRVQNKQRRNRVRNRA